MPSSCVEMSGLLDPLLAEHLDAIEDHNRFGTVRFNHVEWDLTHLNPFPMHVDIGGNLFVTVLVLFSCHCFTHAVAHDKRDVIPAGEVYWDGRERRVLNPERYRLSAQFLPHMIRELPERRIRVAPRENFFTWEVTDSEGKPMHYTVFFEVEKDKRRRKRLLLRVQSAYPIEHLDRKQRDAGKARFVVLLRAAHDGRTIRG